MKKLISLFKDTSLFRRSYIICLFFCSVSFIQIPAYVLLVFLFLWGVALLTYNAIVYHTLLKTRFGIWLILFILVTFITAVIHIKDNFFYNLIINLHIAICFFVFYSIHTEPRFNFRRELYSTCRFIVYTTTVVGIIGIACLMAGISFEVLWIKFIVYENRFTGLYTNPNILGFVSVCGVFCAHMLTKADFIRESEKNRVSRIWIATSLGVNGVGLFLCDSNSSLVLMICYCVFFLGYKLFGNERHFTFKQVAIKTLSIFLLGIFLVLSVFAVRYITQSGFTNILEKTNTVIETVNEDEGEEMLVATGRITFTHENKNIDSGRFVLWRQAAHMFKDFPLFGIGKGNIYDYGKMTFENGIKFSNLYGESLSEFVTDFHNGYATLLVCSGIVGFILFAIFGIRFSKHLIVNIFRDGSLSESTLPCIFAFLCAYLVFAFFEKALLFDVSFQVLFFWQMLGYASCFLEKYEPDHLESVYFFKQRFRKGLF